MTPELEALPPKRRAFVLAYVGESMGNATDAARRAGYAKPSEEGHRLLNFAQVVSAIESLRQPVEDARIATIEQLRVFWTTAAVAGVMERPGPNGEKVAEPIDAKERLKATELLGKSQGAFIERREVKVEGQAVVLWGSIADAARAARERKGG